MSESYGKRIESAEVMLAGIKSHKEELVERGINDRYIEKGEKIKLQSDKDFYDPMGKRFEAFRQVLWLTREQLAAKLNVSIKTIEKIENGESLPDLCMLKYLNKEYGLNIIWMISGEGDVILNSLRKAHEELKTKKPGKISVKSRETLEQWELLKVPVVEKIIFRKMEEVKMIFKAQIEALKKCQQLTEVKIKWMRTKRK